MIAKLTLNAAKSPIWLHLPLLSALLWGGAIALPTLPPTALAQPAPVKSVWKVFASESGGFSLLMPGDPTENKNDGVVSYSVTREKEAVTYTVSFTDFPVDPTSEKNGIQEAFNGIKDGIKEEGGTIVDEKSLSLREFPGQELRISMPDGVITRVRSYVVDRRLYLVMASTKNERSLQKSLEGFLNSFKVTPIPTPEAPQETPKK
jgi:hypothetical protein